MKTVVKPLHNLALVERADQKVSDGGVLIPDNMRQDQGVGTVLAVGPGARDAQGNLIPMTVKVGDEIFFQRWSEIQIRGEKFTVVSEEDIVAILQSK